MPRSLDVKVIAHHSEAPASSPVSALMSILAQAGYEIDVLHLVQHAVESGRDSQAVTYLEGRIGDRVIWGVGVDTSVLTASFNALIAVVNRSRHGAAVETRASVVSDGIEARHF